jgi:cell division protein FtsQ
MMRRPCSSFKWRNRRRLGKRNRRIRLCSSPSRLLPFWTGQVWPVLRRLGRFYILGLFALLSGTGVLLIRYLATHSRHFALRQIRCGHTTRISCEALVERAEVALGTNLFSIDVGRVGRKLAQDPWVRHSRARLELPSTLALDAVEHDLRCAVALRGLYLVDSEGAVFKRAAPEELAGLAVVTGIDREEFLVNPDEAKNVLRQAVSFLDTWRGKGRPPLGEIHLDRDAGFTIYTVSGTGVRFGRFDEGLPSRLERFDAVFRALTLSGEAARFVYLDNRNRPDRITVKLANTPRRLTQHAGEQSGEYSSGGLAGAADRVFAAAQL